MGDGTRVKFWNHVWCGECTLQEAFSELYCISRTKDSLVAEAMCWSARTIHWDIQFRLALQDWEQESIDLFMDWSTLQLCGGLVLIRFVGSQQGVEVLRLEESIFLSTLLLSYPSLGE